MDTQREVRGHPMKRLFVVDVESTCHPAGQKPPGFFSEIIEIGMAVVEPGKIGPTSRMIGSIIVKPILSPRLSSFCKELTGIAQEEVESGIPFRQAMASVRALFLHENAPWDGAVFCSWGNYDRKIFLRNIGRLGGEYPFGSAEAHINLKHEFAGFYHVDVGKSGMDRALGKLGIELIGRHHRGGDDAANIARISCRMIADGWRHALSE